MWVCVTVRFQERPAGLEQQLHKDVDRRVFEEPLHVRSDTWPSIVLRYLLAVNLTSSQSKLSGGGKKRRGKIIANETPEAGS